MNRDDLTMLYQANQTVVISLAVLAGVGLMLLIASRLHKMTGHRATLLVANILTVIAAALATMVSASGMWKFFTDILGESPLRYIFFGYIEVALFASALLARARLLREPGKGSTGVDGAAVWVFAALTASLSALDSDSFREVCLRLAAPLVAAWMWERALAAERSVRLGRTARRINWTITLERVFIWLRLAEAHGRDMTEVDRARRRARLGRARLNLYLLQNRKTSAWRLRRAHNKVIRQAMAAAEHIGLADAPSAVNEREAIQMYMATIYGFVDATTPEAVAHLNAWRADAATTGPVGAGQLATHDGTDAAWSPARTLPLTALMPQRVNGHGAGTDPDRLTVNGRVNGSAGGPDGPGPDFGDDRELVPQDESPYRDGLAGLPSEQPEPHVLDDEPVDDDDDDTGAGADADADAEQRTDEESDLSAVAAMRRFWHAEISKGRIPTGAELSRAAGVPPQTGLGRRKRREWEADLPDHLRSSAGAAR